MSIGEMQIVSDHTPEIPGAGFGDESDQNIEWVDAEFVYRSWPFRAFRIVSRLAMQLLGFATLVLIVAMVSVVPVIQWISFGFLLEASGRVGRSGRLRDGLMGLEPSARIGLGLLGTGLCLLPLLLLGQFWYAAYLVDPSSVQTQGLRIAQLLVAVLTGGHLLAAWFCGGRFRYFVWPIIAPVSLTFWTIHHATASRFLHPVIRLVSYPISRHLAADLLHVPPLKNWFLPAIVFDRIRRGSFWSRAADGLWDFVSDIPMKRLFLTGLIGFVGSMIWLAVPTLLMIAGTSEKSGGAALVSLAGVFLSTGVFCFLLVSQAEFATTRRWQDLFAIRTAFLRVRQAPIWHVIATLATLLLALPLFLAKIEEIPHELQPLLSVVFVGTGWLSRLLLGWANGRARRAARPRRWWWALPVASLMIPLSFAFVVILFFTRYVSWHGAWSLLENPVFLLPAPFWL
jgi:hypothetical protein